MFKKNYERLLNVLGFIRLTELNRSDIESKQRDSVIYQSKLFSNNNSRAKKSFDVDTNDLVDKIIVNLDKTQYKEEKGEWSIAEIFYRKNGLRDMNNAIIVFNPKQYENVYLYADQKSDWQLKTSSIIVFSEKVAANEILTINLNQTFKRNVSLKRVSVIRAKHREDFAYTKEHNRMFLFPAISILGKKHYEKVVESHKNISGKEKEKIKNKNAVKRLEKVAEEMKKEAEDDSQKQMHIPPKNFEGIKEPEEGVKNIYEDVNKPRRMFTHTHNRSTFAGLKTNEEITLKKERIAKNALQAHNKIMYRIDHEFNHDYETAQKIKQSIRCNDEKMLERAIYGEDEKESA